MNRDPHSLLAQCAASGQLDASQVYAHQQAGELPIRFVGDEPADELTLYRYTLQRIRDNKDMSAKGMQQLAALALSAGK